MAQFSIFQRKKQFKIIFKDKIKWILNSENAYCHSVQNTLPVSINTLKNLKIKTCQLSGFQLLSSLVYEINKPNPPRLESGALFRGCDLSPCNLSAEKTASVLTPCFICKLKEPS